MRRKRTVSSEKESNNKTVIIVAVIGLLGTIVTGYFGFLASMKSPQIIINATQTAEARLTLLSPITLVATSTSATQPEIPTPTSTEPPSTVSASHSSKILFDKSLDEWGGPCPIGDINIVKSFGYQVDFSESSINSSLLKQYSIIWLHNPSWELLSQEQNDALLDYVVSGGSILLIDIGNIAFGSLLNGAPPDSYYPEQGVREGAGIRLYSSSFGLGRIAWVYPKTANPCLYFDGVNQETALEIDKVRQILNWLETGKW